MSAALVASAAASIADAANAWAVTGQSSMSTSQAVPASVGPPPTAAGTIVTTFTTIQLTSEPLGSIRVFMAQIVNGSLSSLTVNVNGTAYDVTDTGLFATLQTMAASALATGEAALIADFGAS